MNLRPGYLRGRGVAHASVPFLLDLSFLSGVPGGVTFTRASAATYTDASGLEASATTDTLRFDFSGGVALGALIEDTATNSLLHSNMASGWAFTSASFTQSATTGPDGVAASAVKLVEVAATTQHFGSIGSIPIGAAGSTVTGSVWLKPDALRTTATIKVTDGAIATGCSAFLNLTTGAITSTATQGTGTVAGATAIPYANGWVRYTLTGTIDPATSTTARFAIMISNASYAGDGASGVFSFGGQVEPGTSASAYIPTTTVAVTRAADVLSFTIPAGVGRLSYTFDDNSQQTVTVSPGAYTVPVNLNRRRIKRITGTA